jgi:RND family efflux transporter MFP subunit
MERRLSQPLLVGIIAGATILVIVALRLLASQPPEREQPDRAPLVRVEQVMPQEFQFEVRAHGSVSPRSESDLVPQVSGDVVWVSRSLAAGGFFEKGDPLLRIDRADYEVELEATRATVARAASEHQRAKTELERQRQLADRSVASQARIDDAENTFRVTEAQLREARARRSRAARDLERTEIRAPYEGRVRSEKVDVGQFVQRGNPVATLYAVDFAEIRLPLPDRELAYLDVPLAGVRAGAEEAPESAAGPSVTLRAEFAGRAHEWEGRIVRTEGELDPRSRMVHVVARVADPYGEASEAPLAVGLLVEATIAGRSVPNAYVLPRTALRPDDRIYVVDGKAQLRFRDVEVLRTESDRIVVGKGLVPGDRVCVSPLAAAVDGMRVRVIGDEPAIAGAGS